MKDDFASDLDFSENNTNTNDLIINEAKEDIDNESYENTDLAKEFKIYLRLLRRKYNTFIRQKLQKNFVNIIYLTLDCPPYTKNFSKSYSPIEYITEFQKQYPDKNIQILIPLINIDNDFKPSKKLSININGKMRNIEKTSLCFKYFIQNKLHEAIVYKLPRTESNIQVYGIYSETFSHCKDITEISRLQNLAPFLKSARIVIKKMSKIGFSPDIVHCENIPFYLGGEFENKLPYQIKVLQSVKDFMQYDLAKTEAFWAAINLADKSAMRKICKDDLIKKCVAKLFSLYNAQKFYKMKDCLRFIYKNYYAFRKYVEKGDDIEENIIFNRSKNNVSSIFSDDTCSI